VYAKKEYDAISYRINFIKDFTNIMELDPLININCDNNDYTITNTSNIQKYNIYKIMDQHIEHLKHIKSSPKAHIFKGIFINKNCCNIDYAMKVVPYLTDKRYGNINNIRRPENVEIVMLKFLSDFVVMKNTHHIILPICTFKTSAKLVIKLLQHKIINKDDEKYEEFINKYNNNQYHDHVSILIKEWANNGNFLDFIRKNYKEFALIDWKVLFFQIISVLAVIQSKFENFKHNNLKSSNILVHKVAHQNGTLCAYNINRTRYVVPSIGYMIKINDFRLACISGVIDNSKVNDKCTDNKNINSTKNRYYDLHYFFNTLIKKDYFPELMTDECIPKEVVDFIDRVVPSKFRDGENISIGGRILNNNEYVIPEKILKNDIFFDEFKVKI
jgi:hypothetical protein